MVSPTLSPDSTSSQTQTVQGAQALQLDHDALLAWRNKLQAGNEGNPYPITIFLCFVIEVVPRAAVLVPPQEDVLLRPLGGIPLRLSQPSRSHPSVTAWDHVKGRPPSILIHCPADSIPGQHPIPRYRHYQARQSTNVHPVRKPVY